MLTMSMDLTKVGFSMQGHIVCMTCAGKNQDAVLAKVKAHNADLLYKNDLKGLTICETCGGKLGG